MPTSNRDIQIEIFRILRARRGATFECLLRLMSIPEEILREILGRMTRNEFIKPSGDRYYLAGDLRPRRSR